MKEVRDKARQLMKGYCRVCPVCNGKACSGEVPGMGGLELLGLLRRRPDTKFTPVIVLTTESQRDMRQRAVAAGATGWIVKPFDPGSLVALVRRFLS